MNIADAGKHTVTQEPIVGAAAGAALVLVGVAAEVGADSGSNYCLYLAVLSVPVTDWSLMIDSRECRSIRRRTRLQVKPLLLPLQLPERYLSASQVMLLQAQGSEV